MDEFDDEGMGGSGIFPFLSVLCCVIGTMILILVAGSLQAANIGGSDPTVARDIAARQQVITSLSSLVAEQELSLERLQEETQIAKAYAGGIQDLGSLRERQASLERSIDHTVARMSVFRSTTASILSIPRKSALIGERARAGEERVAAEGETAAARARLAEVEARRDQLAETVEELRRMAGGPIEAIAVTGRGEGLEPVIVELRVDAVVMPDGSAIPPRSAEAEGGPFDRLAMEIARPGSGKFALLVVRPGALDGYRACSEALRRRRAPFKAEPLEDGREMALGGDD